MGIRGKAQLVGIMAGTKGDGSGGLTIISITGGPQGKTLGPDASSTTFLQSEGQR